MKTLVSIDPDKQVVVPRDLLKALVGALEETWEDACFGNHTVGNKTKAEVRASLNAYKEWKKAPPLDTAQQEPQADATPELMPRTPEQKAATREWIDSIRSIEAPQPAQPVAYRYEKSLGANTGGRAYTETPDKWYQEHGWACTPLFTTFRSEMDVKAAAEEIFEVIESSAVDGHYPGLEEIEAILRRHAGDPK